MRSIYRRHLWKVLPIAVLLVTVIAGLLQLFPFTGKAAGSNFSLYQDPFYGYTLKYASTWNILHTSGHGTTFVAPGTPATCQVSIAVTRRAESAQKTLLSALPQGAYAVVHKTVDGSPALAFSTYSNQVQTATGYSSASTKKVLVAQSITTHGVNLYTLSLDMFPAAFVKHNTATSYVSCGSSFDAMVTTFSLAKGSVAEVGPSYSSNNPAIQYAYDHWNWNYFNHSSARDCLDGSYKNCISEAEANAGRFQPDFQCAEFVARALSTEGYVNLSATADSPDAYAKYSSFDLNYVGDSKISGLYQYLLNKVGAVNILNNISSAQEGDVIFYYTTADQDSREHVALIVDNTSDSHTYVAAHNIAQQHADYLQGNTFDHFSILHLPPPPTNNPGTKLFDAPNYVDHGNSVSYQNSGNTYNLPAGANDNTSSIYVAPGWAVTVYQNSNAGGLKKTFTASVADLSSVTFNNSSLAINNQISSILLINLSLVCSPFTSIKSKNVLRTANTSCQPPPNTCPNTAGYIADITYPDGTAVTPGQSFSKTWRLQNTSTTCTWSGLTLNFVSGVQMSGPTSVAVPTTGPGQTVDITVPLVAPNGSGTYRGNWQLVDSQGVEVSQGGGGTVWVQISVPYSNGSGGGGTDSISASYPSVVTPGQHFQPQVTVNIASGQLLQSRGDMLRNNDGNLYGSWPFVAVVGTVNPGSPYTFTFYTNNPIVAPSSEGTYSSTWQVWQNGTWYGSPITITFTVKNGGGTRPATPTPTSPGNWFYARDGATPTLCANTSSANVQYDFQIYQSAQTPDSGWINGNCWTPNPSLGPYTFAWHVKVRDTGSGLESDWSTTWNFSIASQQLTMDPISFSPTSPSNADTIFVRSCVHGFGDVNLGLSYDINSATDGSANGDWHGFTNAGNNCPDINNVNSWGQFPSRNYADGDHLVRATGTGPQGQTMVVTSVYHLNHRRPQDVQLVSPTNNVRVNSDAVSFVWQPSISATSYRLVISPNADFSSPLFDQNVGNVSTYQYTFSQDLSPAYWEVYAINDVGQTVNQTSFGIDRVAPVASVTALPATTPDSTFTVTWSGSDANAGVEWYNVQYRDGNAAGSTWVNWQTNTTAIAALFTGQPGHSYYFRAQAMDKASNLSVYAGGDGDTYTLIDLNTRPQTPWWNTGYAGKRNLVVLNNDPQALPTGYPVHLHFDAGTNPSANDIFSASLSNTAGDDIRLVYQDQTEIPRFLANFSASQVDIWFDLQASLAPNPTTDTSDYQLYYGNASAVNPPGDPNSVLPPGLDTNVMGLWHAQDASGSSLTDASGRGHTGNINNGSWNTTGKFGSAVVFNGSNTTVNLGDSPDFDLRTFTLEGWFKFYNPGTQVIMRRSDSGKAEDAYHFGTRDGKIEYQLDGRSALRSTTPFQANVWYHIALTYDGTTMAIFINGVENASQTDTGGVPPSAGQLILGNNRSNSDWFNGEMQGIRVSNVARASFPYGAFATTQAEPSTNAGSSVTPPQTGTPSLAVQSVNVIPGANGTNTMVVVVQNQGSVATGNGFTTDLYLNHQPTGPGDYTGSVSSWVASPIVSNQNVTLSTTISVPGTNLKVNSAGIPTETTQTFYVQADATGALAHYDQSNLTITGPISVCTASSDAYKGDNTSATANPILTNGKAQVHNFNAPGIQDWVSFTARKGVTYVINTSNLGPNADTVLSLYGPDGTTLLASNNQFNGTPGSRIIWKAPASGTYYTQVTNWNPLVSGCGTSYSLAVQQSAALSSYQSATYNQQINISGQAFAVGETVNVYLDSIGTTALATTTASPTGTIAKTFTMPQSVLGVHTLYAVGQTSQKVGMTAIQVKAKVILSRTSGKQGTTITITGYGFLGYVQDITENVNVYWGSATGPVLGSSATNSLGTTNTINVTVPTASPGTYTLYVVGQASGTTLTIPFTVLK